MTTETPVIKLLCALSRKELGGYLIVEHRVNPCENKVRFSLTYSSSVVSLLSIMKHMRTKTLRILALVIVLSMLPYSCQFKRESHSRKIVLNERAQFFGSITL